MKILVAGGAGFIGSNFVRYLLRQAEDDVVVLDKLTYAGTLENLRDVADDHRYRFIEGDIADPQVVREAIDGVDVVANFAAETHVDRSILDPGSFIRTDVYGAYVLLEAARVAGVRRFLQVSTDEVYGQILGTSSTERAPLEPRSPYAASKAAADLLVHAYHTTYGLPTIVTRGSNTFGPYQHIEKLIPLVITEALDHHPVPVYGDGQQIREWLFVDDHCAGIDCALRNGTAGEAYNIGGETLRRNLEVVERILGLLGRPLSLIRHIADRPGHDRGYWVDSTKLSSLGWSPEHKFEETLAETVDWYVSNEQWWRRIKESAQYQEYFRRNYAQRDTLSFLR